MEEKFKNPVWLKLTRDEINQEIKSLNEMKTSMSGVVDDFLKSDMIDKISRYGDISYVRKFKSPNLCSHMRVFNHTKELNILINNQLNELNKEKLRIDRIIGNRNV